MSRSSSVSIKVDTSIEFGKEGLRTMAWMQDRDENIIDHEIPIEEIVQNEFGYNTVGGLLREEGIASMLDARAMLMRGVAEIDRLIQDPENVKF